MTNTINVSVPLTPAYSNPYVNISPSTIGLNITLKEGSNVYRSPLTNVGTLTHFADPVLQAKFVIWYNFDSANNTITLCGNDLVSDDATYVMTAPQNSSQKCKQHTYSGDNTPCGGNENWNYCTGLTPGLAQALQQTVRQANTTFLKAAKQQFTVIVRTPPPTLSLEHSTNLAAVYQDNKFIELFDESKSYGKDCILKPIESIWYGEIYLESDDYFANVIGSTNDPKVASKSWIKLWESHYGQSAQDCTSRDYKGFDCSGNLVGGHVILGKKAKNVQRGSNSVFIIPICSAHNSNDNVYMAPLKYRKGIALHNYLNN